MLFVHAGCVFRVPRDAFSIVGKAVVQISYKDMEEITSTFVEFGADTFLGASRHPNGLHSSFISVVKTTNGYVWVSRIRVEVPAETRRVNGLTEAEALVGEEFVWSWNVGKAVISWTRFASASMQDGAYRPLAHACPSRTTMAAGLGPHNVKGCEEVKWSDLTDGQRFFLAHVHPLSATLSQSNNPLADACYRDDARVMMDKRRKAHSKASSGAPLSYLVTPHNDLLYAEDRVPTMSSLFGLSCAANRRRLQPYLGTVRHIIYTAEWSTLPSDVVSLILSRISEEAFTAPWRDQAAAASVCALRLVCRNFRDSLDASLALLWNQNVEFSRRVFMGAPPTKRPPLADVGIYHVASLAREASSWRKLVRLRQKNDATRKQKTTPFINRPSVAPPLTFMDASGGDLSRLKMINPGAKFDNNYMSYRS